MANRTNYRDILKNKEYTKLLFTNLINRFGDAIDAIAFTWLVYQITHSASWAALIYGLNILPNIIAQPFFGALVETMNKQKVIVFTHLSRGLVISAFVLMYITGKINPYYMAIFTLTITTIESLNLPASTAFIPSVIKKDQLSHAISLNSSLSGAVSLAGTGVAGIIIANLGVHTAMLIDAATFLFAALGILMIRVEDKKTSESNSAGAQPMHSASGSDTDLSGRQKKAERKTSYLNLLKDGIRYLMQNRVILNYCFVAVILNFFLVPLNALEAPITEDLFGLGSMLLSVIGIAASAGSIMGSAILPKLTEKFTARQLLITCGFALGFFMYLLSWGKYLNKAVIPGYLLAGTCYLVMTTAASVMGGALSIYFIQNVDQKYLARAASIFNASASAAMPVGSLLISLVTLRLSTSFLISAGGIMAIIFFMIITITNMDFELKGELSDAA